MSIATNMFTIAITPKRGLFPYAIHMRDSANPVGTARLLLRTGFLIHGRRFNPANIRSITVTGPDGKTVAVTG